MEMSKEAVEVVPVIVEPNDVSSDIATLEKLNMLACKESLPAVENSKMETPVAAMERKLEQYMGNGLRALTSDLEFTEEWKSIIRERFSTMDDKVLMNAFANWNTVLNDRISKMTAPPMNLFTERQKAEIAEANKREMASERRANAQQNNITINTAPQVSGEKAKALNEDATPEVINGLNNLYSLLGAFAAAKQKLEQKENEDK